MLLFSQLNGTLRWLFEQLFNIGYPLIPQHTVTEALPETSSSASSPIMAAVGPPGSTDSFSPSWQREAYTQQLLLVGDLIAKRVLSDHPDYPDLGVEDVDDCTLEEALAALQKMERAGAGAYDGLLKGALVAEDVGTRGGKVARPLGYLFHRMQSVLEFDYSGNNNEEKNDRSARPLAKIEAVSNASPDTFSWTASASTVRSGG